MEFSLNPSEAALKQEICQFLRQELPPGWIGVSGGEGLAGEDEWELAKVMTKKLAARHWLTMAWPKEYGGLGASHVEHLIYQEEVAYHGVPGADMGVGGVSWIGPTLILFGSEAQKRQHLSGISSGKVFWCTGYSEPNAGSDLASLQIRAVEDGGDFVVNGQKVWTSAAHRAQWCWLAVRTDPSAPKHKGISILMVDMSTPGITVRPLTQASGVAGFSEVFYKDVRIPKANLVGDKNRGWDYLWVSLSFERTLGVNYAAMGRRLIDELVKFAKETKHRGQPLSQDPLIRNRLAELALECQVGRLLGYRIAWMLEHNLIPLWESSAVKNFSAELFQRVACTGMGILGRYGLLEPGSRWAPLRGAVEGAYLTSLGATIAAGTAEINRNIIAQRGLGLPRG